MTHAAWTTSLSLFDALLMCDLFCRHVAEYTLGSLSRVMTTEQGTTVAGPKELYSALCEDEALYGMVKKMQSESARTSLEASDRPRTGCSPPISLHASCSQDCD